MLKRLLAIVIFSQLLFGCDIEVGDIPDLLTDVDIRIGMQGDITTVVALTKAVWKNGDWIGVTFAPTFGGNTALGGAQDISTIFEIGYMEGNKPLFKRIAQANCAWPGKPIVGCTLIMNCKYNGTTVTCNAGDKPFLPKADRDVTFIPEGKAILRTTSCNADFSAKVITPKTCTTTANSIRLKD